MDNWDDFINEQYESYLLQHCTCDRSEDCYAMSLQRFEDQLIRDMEEACAERIWEAQQEAMECYL
jgi:hypothetical protein